jgi:hypothetical protein
MLRHAAVWCLLLLCAAAHPPLRNLIPNGHAVYRNGALWPAVGHDIISGGPVLNPFGAAFFANGFRWNASFCGADSDGDGFTNGQELGDPECQWTVGASVPVSWRAASHPGFNDSYPIANDAAATLAMEHTLPGVAAHSLLGALNESWRVWAPRNVFPPFARGTPFCSARAWDSVACDFSSLATAMGGVMNTTAWPPALTALNVSSQQLSGTLNLAALQHLAVTDIVARGNQLSLPLDLQQLPQTLAVLDVSHNAFQGDIAVPTALPAALRHIDMSGNSLSTVSVDLAALPLTLHLALGTVGVLRYRCNSSHPTLSLVTTDGQTNVALAAGREIPRHCSSCKEGDVYNLASPLCDFMAAGPSTRVLGSGSVVLENESFCDSGCTASVVVLCVGVAAVLVFAACFKPCFAEPVEDDRAPGKEDVASSEDKEMTNLVASGDEPQHDA